MNHLYYGDNLDVLRRYIPDESVDLCYIDPPFNSKRNYNQIYTNQGKEDFAQAQAFIDTWAWDELAIKGFQDIVANKNGVFSCQTINLILGLEKVLGMGSLLAYLVSITQRVAEIFRVLKPTGSFYFHCDPTSSHYIKLVLDSVFCSQGGDYRNEITWKRTNVHNDSKTWSNVSDIIFFYTKSSKFTWNPIYSGHSDSHLNSKYRHQEADGRRYCLDNMTSPAPRPNMMYEWKGHASPPNGWRYSKETMEKLDSENRIWYPDKITKRPRRKRYLDETKGRLLDNVWSDIAPLNSQAKERLGYPTQKPEELMERIIQASSNAGDTVLDAYCGCGTTVAVAQRLNRRWIGVDITYQSVSLILKRLEDSYGTKVLDSVKVAGIPQDMNAAIALANRKDDRTRKEFEKWAVLTYTRNRAVINQKKGADQGIDGTVFFLKPEGGHGRIIFQVKSGNAKSSDIRDLYGTVTREKADMGIFITLKEPTKAMIKEANSYGTFHHEFMNRDYSHVEIVTIQEILEGKCLSIPLSLEVLKSAQRKQQPSEQLSILGKTAEDGFDEYATGA